MKHSAIQLLIVLTVSIICLQSSQAAKDGPPPGKLLISESFKIGPVVDIEQCADAEDLGFNHNQSGVRCSVALPLNTDSAFCALTGIEYDHPSSDTTPVFFSCYADSTSGSYILSMDIPDGWIVAYKYCEFRCLTW